VWLTSSERRFDNWVVWIGLGIPTSVAQSDRTTQSLKLCLFSSEARAYFTNE
jgi:hypothetical protein